MLKPTPRECNGCDIETKRRWGCGFDARYKGKARITMGAGLKTCPQYYARDPDVNYILANLEDYKRGALGPVGKLPAHVVDYLRAAEASRGKWLEANELEG